MFVDGDTIGFERFPTKDTAEAELNESFVADVPGKVNADEATWALMNDPSNFYQLSLS